ncbi:MAG: hypothetical protein L0Y55_20480, partial [Anaerolineales bacterium]|nr:hypothetical protein [Anaerolineales bacterium]
SALAYYWDHKEELDQDIQRRLEKVDALRKSTPVPPLIERLKKQGLSQLETRNCNESFSHD